MTQILILNDVAKFVTSKIEISEIDETNYISTENMLPNKGGVIEASSLPDTQTVREYQSSDILINNIRPYFKKIWFSDKNGGCSNDVFVLRAKNNYDSKFLYYVLSSDDFFSYVMSTAKGTKMPRGDKKAIQNYNVPEFLIEDQMKISNLLNGIDQKIEVNKKINRNLLSIADAIYKKEFRNFDSYPEEELISSDFGLIPKNWYYKTLDEISDVAIGKTPPRKETWWFSENEGVKWVSIKDLGNSGTYIFETSECLTEEAIEKFNVKLIPKDTVILSLDSYSIKEIRDICEINASSYSKKDNWNYFNYLDTKNIIKGEINEIKYLDPSIEKIPSRAKRKVNVDDIIISTVRPNQEHYGMIKYEMDNFLVSTGFTTLTVDKTKAVPEFIYFFITQNHITESLQTIAEQSTTSYPSIRPSDIGDIIINLPPLEIQKRISNILSNIENKIEINKNINRNLTYMVLKKMQRDYVIY